MRISADATVDVWSAAHIVRPSLRGTLLLLLIMHLEFPITTAQATDCIGSWSQCDATCADKTFVVTTEAADGGTECTETNGATRQCLQGDGQCTQDVQERQCVRPSTAGYDFSSASETLSGGSFGVSGIVCSEGYTGTATAAVCNEGEGDYSVSGCAVVVAADSVQEAIAAVDGLGVNQTLAIVGDVVAALDSFDATGEAESVAVRTIVASALLDVARSELSDPNVLMQCSQHMAAITTDPLQLSSQGVDLALEFAEVLVSPTQTPSEMQLEATASIASNILEKSVQYENSEYAASFTIDEAKVAANRVVALVQALGGLVSRHTTVGSEPVTVSTPAFKIIAAKNAVQNIEGASMQGIDGGVKIPAGAFVEPNGRPLPPSEVVTSRVIDWSAGSNPFFYAGGSVRMNQSSDTLHIGSTVKSIDFYDDADQVIRIQGLTEPFKITLPAGNLSVNASMQIYCAYWDTRQFEWVVDGDSDRGSFSATGGGVECNHTHLTDFVALIGPPPQLNKPCTTLECWSKLWLNPWGLAVTAVCGLLVLATCSASCRRYCVVQGKMDHKNFHTSEFAVERKKVLNADSVDPTSCWQDAKHIFSHDYVFGGILRPLAGDPLDRLQRGMLVLTTVLVTMCVNLLLLPPGVTQETSCNETYTGTIECSGEQVEPGILNTLITAGITTPLVAALISLFKNLRKPLMRSVEPQLSIVALGLGGIIVQLVKKLCCKCQLCRHWQDLPVNASVEQVVSAAADAKASAADATHTARRRSVTLINRQVQNAESPDNSSEADQSSTQAAPVLRRGLTVTAFAARNLRAPHRRDCEKMQPYLLISVFTKHEVVTSVSPGATVTGNSQVQPSSEAAGLSRTTPSVAELEGAAVSVHWGSNSDESKMLSVANWAAKSFNDSFRQRVDVIQSDSKESQALQASQESQESGAAMQFDFLVSEELPIVHVACRDAGHPVGECVIDLAQCAQGLQMDNLLSDLNAVDLPGDPRLHADWTWPFRGDESSNMNWFTLKPIGNSLGGAYSRAGAGGGGASAGADVGQSQAATKRGVAQVKLSFAWVTEETLTDPAQDYHTSASNRTAKAAHWREFVFLRAYLYAALLSSAALYFIASFVSNMSADNTKAWAFSVAGATATKLFVMDPLKLLVTSIVMQCVEAWPVSARIIEGHLVAKRAAETPTPVTKTRGCQALSIC